MRIAYGTKYPTPAIDPGARRPISDAPRDGSNILVERLSQRYMREENRIVYASWTAHALGGGYWTLKHGGSSYCQDDKLAGWWPVLGDR